MKAKQTPKQGQKVCEDCILKNNCEYIPNEHELIRCLDKVTGKEPLSPEEEKEAE